MRQRKLITGETVEDSETMKSINIGTYCPSKWLRVDLERGAVYDFTDEYIGKAISGAPGTVLLLLDAKTNWNYFQDKG